MADDFEEIRKDAFDFLKKLNEVPFGRAKKILELQNSILERAKKDENNKLLSLITRNIKNRVDSTRVGANPSFDIGKVFAYQGKTAKDGGVPMARIYREMERFANVMNQNATPVLSNNWQYAIGADTGVRESFSYLGRQERRQEERRRFDTMMGTATGRPISVGDDDQYAFGADTGVRADFQYLADEEREQKERASRRSIMKRRQKANLAKLDMSDYDLFIHEHKADYGGVNGADEAYRKMLLKQLPPFFKDSKLSTKSLVGMAKAVKSMKDVPIIGPALNAMMKNPVSGAAGLIYAGTVAAFAASDKANAQVVSWQNAANLYGVPSRKFLEAGYMAGFKDPGSISKIYGELTARFGDADMFIQSFGKSFGAMTPLARTLVAKQLGLDENTVALIDILSGSGHVPMGETRMTNAYKNMTETGRQLNLQSGAGIFDFFQGLIDSIPGMTGAKARDMYSFGHVKKGVESGMYDMIDLTIKSTKDAAEAHDKAEDAAESYDVYESNGGPTATNTQNIRSASVYIQNMEVASNNPEEFSKGLADIAVSTPGANRALLASFGSGFTA